MEASIASRETGGRRSTALARAFRLTFSRLRSLCAQRELDAEAKLLDRERRRANDFTVQLSKHDHDRLGATKMLNSEVIPQLRLRRR